MEQKWKISKAQKRQRNARTKEEASVSTHTLVAHTRRRVCFYVFLLVLLILSLKNRIIILFHLLSLSLSHSHLFSTTWTRFSSRDHPRFLCISLSLSLSLFLSLSFSLSLSLTHLFTSSINYLLYRLAYISLIRKMFIPHLRSCLRLPCTTVASARCFLRWFPSSLCRSLPKSSQPSF